MSENKSIIDLARAGQAPPQDHESTPTQLSPAQAPASSPPHNAKDARTDIKDALDSLLSKVKDKFNWIPIELPGAGLLGSPAVVNIRPFNFEDEKNLRNIKKISDGTLVVQKLIENCVEDLDYSTLSLIDKNYILFKLREVSYGDDYKVEVTCGQCSEVNALSILFSELPVVYATTELLADLKVTLPDSEVVVSYKLPTVGEESLLADTTSLVDHLWRFIKDINGHTERMVIQGFLPKTTARDVATLREEVFNSSIGLQTQVGYVCNNCNADSVIELPITESFFNVN